MIMIKIEISLHFALLFYTFAIAYWTNGQQKGTFPEDENDGKLVFMKSTDNQYLNF